MSESEGGASQGTSKFAKDFIKKSLKEELKSAMEKSGSSKDFINWTMFVIDNSADYIEYCIKTKKNPDDVKALIQFLESKGKNIAKLSSDDARCVIAIFDFAKNLRDRMKAIRGGPIPATLVVSLLIIDGIAIGNSCTFVQEAFYHATLKTSQVRQMPIQRRNGETSIAPRSEAKDAKAPLDFLRQKPDPRSGLQCVEERNGMMAEALSLL
ncbi:hypothetical protein [Azospirillum brasilense]|nr:hypothetical protein [Azospirillum brasilense]